jgi:hypothetical protein
MCYGRNEDVIRGHSIQNRVRKPIEHKATLASSTLRPSQRRLGNAENCVIDLERKGMSGYLASIAIPRLSFSELLLGFRMKPDLLHPRRNSRDRTSSHGMV